MSPLVLTPAIGNSKPVTPEMSTYRGMSDKREGMTVVCPMKPLQANFNSPSEILNLIFDSQKPQKHILELEKLGHFVSFSLKKEVACCYATNEYKRLGYVVTARFPEIVRGITIVGEGPYIYECNDGTVWLDLRHIPTQWIGAASRTRVDHELLLLEGSIQVSKPKLVRPEECNQSFRPWAKTGEKIICF